MKSLGTAQNISEDFVSLCHGQKSDILKRLNKSDVPKPASKNSAGIAIDLSGIVNAKTNMAFSGVWR